MFRVVYELVSIWSFIDFQQERVFTNLAGMERCIQHNPCPRVTLGERKRRYKPDRIADMDKGSVLGDLPFLRREKLRKSLIKNSLPASLIYHLNPRSIQILKSLTPRHETCL